MRILITDKVPESLLSAFKERGYNFDYIPDIEKGELLKIVNKYEILIVRGRTRVDRELINEATNLKAVIRFGVGLDNIDLDLCKEKGINVYNTPRAFTEAVAELTLSLILGLLRNIGFAHCSICAGEWRKKELYGYELLDKNVAVIGFGRIGRRVAELLKPFKARIIVYDIIKFGEELLKQYNAVQVDSLVDAVKDADIVTIHVPLTKETRNMFSYDIFRSMAKKPFLINTSRGEVVDYDALLYALDHGYIRGYATDVYHIEPFYDERLTKRRNVLLTPHIGSQTYEAGERAVEETIEIVEKIFKNIERV